MIFAIQGWSQATLNEGFEGTVFPPDEWRIENTLGSSTPWTPTLVQPMHIQIIIVVAQ